jgi:K+-sensing histidine kinase KdpD
MQENLTQEDWMALERNVTLARAQQAEVETLHGKDPIKAILDYARLGGTPLDRLIRDAEGFDVRVFPQ